MTFDLSIIIVNWNTCELLAKCLQSVYQATSSMNIELIVVDNGSVDDSVAMMERDFPHVHIIINTVNIGFVSANNQAISKCMGRHVLLLNSDTTVMPDSVKMTLRFMDEHPDVGILGVRLLNTDGTFQASHSPFPTLLQEFLILSGLGRWLIRDSFPSFGPLSEKGPQKVKGYVEGAYLMARCEAIDKVGMFDERIFMYAEEVDWCYRCHKAGWEVWYLPQAFIIHHRGQSSKKRPGRMEAQLYRSRIYFFHKHYGRVSASRLKVLIYTMTIIKILLHKFLYFITNGKRGRTVSGLKELHLALINVCSELKEKTAS